MDELHPQQRPPVENGEILADKYRVDQVIGVGGMGVVVAATHVDLDQRVALKFLQPHAALDAALVERFVREGKAAVRLKSEHVARVLDVGRMKDGMPYIVMEFLEGNTLACLVKERGPLPVAEAVGYMLQACDAVAEAHAAKIVHRDLKPENLFVTSRNDGRPLVKVLDFGISKALDGKSQSLTQTDSMMGSPAYMAPEQMRSSKDVDERADIWSLGAILYELTTGKLPYIAESLASLAFMLVEGPPPSPRAHNPDLPEALDRIIMRCLERDRNVRIRDIASLAKEIVQFANEDDKELVARISSIQSSQQRAAFSSLPDIVAADTVLLPQSPSSSKSVGSKADSSGPVGLKTAGGWGTTNSGKTPLKRSGTRAPLFIGGIAVIALGVIGVVAQRTLSHADPVGMKSEPAAMPPTATLAIPANNPSLANRTEMTAASEPSKETTPAAPVTPIMSQVVTKNVSANAKPKPEPAVVAVPPKASSTPAPKASGNGFIHDRE